MRRGGVAIAAAALIAVLGVLAWVVLDDDGEGRLAAAREFRE